MLYNGGMAQLNKLAKEIIDELKHEEANKDEKKAYYANFPKELYERFEKAIHPTAPTKAFMRFMIKVVDIAEKKK